MDLFFNIGDISHRNKNKIGSRTEILVPILGDTFFIGGGGRKKTYHKFPNLGNISK